MSTYICLNCNTEHKKRGIQYANKYCNNKCQKDYEYKQSIAAWLESGAAIGKGALKRYLSETRGDKCSCCNITEWNGKKIVFELEHIDGNSKNNSLDNVCLICPNCHSQTDTFKGKNRSNGRHTRRVRYAEGKSF